ncbi:25400_t:CDS:2, partial [Racocetra persica]
MSLSSEAKKCLCESLHQQYLNQKLAEYNKAKKLFIDLTDLNYKPGHRNHMYYKYLLSSNNKNDTALLEKSTSCPILDIDARQKPDPTNSELPSLDSEKIS